MGPCPYGLPQGSVLGPLLYIIYTSKIGPLLTATSVLGHLYAEDIQAYLHCPASNATAAVLAMSKTLSVPETWMSPNHPRLNPSETQFIRFSTWQLLAKPGLSTIAADLSHFILSSVVRDFGAGLDLTEGLGGLNPSSPSPPSSQCQPTQLIGNFDPGGSDHSGF